MPISLHHVGLQSYSCIISLLSIPVVLILPHRLPLVSVVPECALPTLANGKLDILMHLMQRMTTATLRQIEPFLLIRVQQVFRILLRSGTIKVVLLLLCLWHPLVEGLAILITSCEDCHG